MWGSAGPRGTGAASAQGARRGDDGEGNWALALGAALLLVSSAAMAQTKQQEAKMIAHACGGDIDRLCPGVPPGEGRIKACVKAHVTELSPGCFDTMMGAVAAEKEP